MEQGVIQQVLPKACAATGDRQYKGGKKLRWMSET